MGGREVILFFYLGDRISSCSWPTGNRRRSTFDRHVASDGFGTTLVRALTARPSRFVSNLIVVHTAKNRKIKRGKE